MSLSTVDYTAPFAAALLLAVAGLVVLVSVGLGRLGFRIARRKWPLPRLHRVGLALLIGGLVGAWGVARIKGATPPHAAVDLVVSLAPRPPPGWREAVVPPAPYLLLAGDLHCHINPPDWWDHVARHLPETLRLAHDEGLDFVALVPHVFSDFYANPAQRTRITAQLADLQRAVDARPKDDLIVSVGIEYTDPTGHVGMVFGDVPAALAATPADVAAAHPGAFFDAFADRGGLLLVNHPLLTAVNRWLPLASLDISWQPFTGRPPFRPEIAAVDARADGFEVANLFVSAFRDRVFHGDSEDSTRRVLARLDHEIPARGRRMTPVGGTDSHSFHLRPMTFVLAEHRSREGIRDAIRAGRTCVLQPAACTFEVRAEGAEAFAPVGSSVRAVHTVEARARGQAVVIYRNGEQVAAPANGEVVRIDVAPQDPGACTVLRATVDGGYSAPVYVNCTFAERSP